MHFELAFQLHLQLEKRAIKFFRRDLAIDARDLPEHGFVCFGVRTKHLWINPARAVKQDMQANFADLAANLIDDILRARPVMRRDHHVSDPKISVRRQRGTQARFRQPLRPQLTRNICHYADAIALAIDIARSVAHAGERFNGPLDVAVRRLPALAHRTDQSAGVAMLSINRVKVSERIYALDFVYTRHISPLQ